MTHFKKISNGMYELTDGECTISAYSKEEMKSKFCLKIIRILDKGKIYPILDCEDCEDPCMIINSFINNHGY